MSRTAQQELFALVESFFLEYLPRQRGASPHTVRAYRDSVKLLFKFMAQSHGRDISSLVLDNLDADAITAFLDHIEGNRSNSAATRNLRWPHLAGQVGGEAKLFSGSDLRRQFEGGHRSGDMPSVR
jgi:hypothetical protein